MHVYHKKKKIRITRQIRIHTQLLNMYIYNNDEALLHVASGLDKYSVIAGKYSNNRIFKQSISISSIRSNLNLNSQYKSKS